MTSSEATTTRFATTPGSVGSPAPPVGVARASLFFVASFGIALFAGAAGIAPAVLGRAVAAAGVVIPVIVLLAGGAGLALVPALRRGRRVALPAVATAAVIGCASLALAPIQHVQSPVVVLGVVQVVFVVVGIVLALGAAARTWSRRRRVD